MEWSSSESLPHPAVRQKIKMKARSIIKQELRQKMIREEIQSEEIEKLYSAEESKKMRGRKRAEKRDIAGEEIKMQATVPVTTEQQRANNIIMEFSQADDWLQRLATHGRCWRCKDSVTRGLIFNPENGPPSCDYDSTCDSELEQMTLDELKVRAKEARENLSSAAKRMAHLKGDYKECSESLQKVLWAIHTRYSL